jgi:hypothetical protein
MTTEEHLEKIVAKCRANLALAARRTPGKWIHDKSRESIGDVTTEDRDGIAQAQERISVAGKGRVAQNVMRDNNAAFIAACAGAAEAGWRATIAAVERLKPFSGHDTWAASILADILSAWPEELL